VLKEEQEKAEGRRGSILLVLWLYVQPARKLLCERTQTMFM
jgi:hypothetical protein